MESKKQVDKNQITNRHIAKLLDRINEVVELPEIVATDIKRQMHFLKEDLTQNGESEKNGNIAE